MWRQQTRNLCSVTGGRSLKAEKWDALVIGGGHNGLTAAAYLVPGYKFSRCSYLQSLLRPALIKELELKRHGLKMLKRSPSSLTPCLDGRYLLLGPDKELNYSEILKFSKRDAEAYPRDFMDLLLSPASVVFNNWFENDVLKATLATDAVIGTMGSPNTPGSGYVLLHHVMGETDGDRGIWSYVQGGMGSVSLAISRAAKEAGATIVTEAEVSELMIEDPGRVCGVLLADGTQVRSSVVLSNATPYRTFMEFVPKNVLPDDFLRAIKNSDYSSATTKINLAVNKLPQFHCCKLGNPDVGPQHMGTIHIGSETEACN